MIGVVLWVATVAADERTGTTVSLDPEAITGDHPTGPRN